MPLEETVDATIGEPHELTKCQVYVRPLQDEVARLNSWVEIQGFVLLVLGAAFVVRRVLRITGKI